MPDDIESLLLRRTFNWDDLRIFVAVADSGSLKQAASRLLTTQLYFPNEPANRRDPLFRRELLMRVADAGDGFAAKFDFVLDVR